MTSEAEPNHKHPTKQTSVAKFPKHRYAGTSPHILRYLSAYHGYIEQLQRTERTVGCLYILVRGRVDGLRLLITCAMTVVGDGHSNVSRGSVREMQTA